MKLASARQRWAVWVMISFLASAVAVWGITAAGNRVREGKYCRSVKTPELEKELKHKPLALELAPADAPTLLEVGGPRAPCIESWVRANLYADFLFIPSYSAFLAFAILLLASPRESADPTRSGWKACGVLLAVVMAAADVTENLQLLGLLDGRETPLLPWATLVKWWAIALAMALAGLVALERRQAGRFLPVLIGATGLLVGASLAACVSVRPWNRWVEIVSTGGMALFFLLVLIEAIVSMAQAGYAGLGKESRP
jgi:hypothetical protein